MYKGKFSILHRSSSNSWYLRIEIPLEVAMETNLRSGQYYNIENVDRTIVVSQDIHGAYRFPEITGQKNPGFWLDLSARSLDMQPMKREQFRVEMVATGNCIKFELPKSYKYDEIAPRIVKRRRKRAENCFNRAAYLRMQLGQKSFASVIVEGARNGINVKPMSMEEIVSYLQSLGMELSRIGPKLFRIDGRTANYSDLQDEFKRNYSEKGVDNTVLVLD